MRHEAYDVPRFVTEAGYRGGGSVGVPVARHVAIRVGVAEDHLSVGLESSDDVGLREIVAFAVGDRKPQHLAPMAGRGEGRIGLFNADVNVLTEELQVPVAEHGSGQQAGLEKNLEAVTDSEHRT